MELLLAILLTPILVFWIMISIDIWECLKYRWKFGT